jgi:exosortase H (IPTLxxWG-CTERM-specific)
LYKELENSLSTEMLSNIQSPTHRDGLRKFAIRFGAVAGVLYILFNWLPTSWVADPLSRQTAAMTAFLLGIIGVTSSVSGALVSTPSFAVKIIPECTAIFVATLFSSFVAAYPASLKQKATGLAAGLSFLFAANLLRVLLIFLVGMKSRDLFEIAHVYIGQIVMILLVLLTCMTWLRSMTSVHMQDRPFPFLIRCVAYSSLPFALWLYLDQGFVFANLFLIKSLLHFFGFHVAIPEQLKLYPQTFNTFHLIAFTALILATRSIDPSKKARSLAIGIILLCTTHFLFRLHQVLFLDFHVSWAFRPFVASIIIDQWILPFGLWLFMARNELFKRQGRYICPVCGEEKAGILDHIKAKHEEHLKRDISL